MWDWLLSEMSLTYVCTKFVLTYKVTFYFRNRRTQWCGKLPLSHLQMKSIYSTLADSHGSSCLSISLQRCKYTRHIKSPSNVSKALAPSRPMPVRKDRVTLNMVMKTFLGRSPRKRATCKSRGSVQTRFRKLMECKVAHKFRRKERPRGSGQCAAQQRSNWFRVEMNRNIASIKFIWLLIFQSEE